MDRVHDIVQETGIKTIPKKKKCKKAKWLFGEGLQIAVKRREVKNKGEKDRYKHLNAEFQRIARRDKKASFSNQCKEIEEKNRMGGRLWSWGVDAQEFPGGIPEAQLVLVFCQASFRMTLSRVGFLMLAPSSLLQFSCVYKNTNY